MLLETPRLVRLHTYDRPVVSVVVPTLNEAENIEALIQRLDAALTEARIPYEIAIIDDHSTDTTDEIAANLARVYPVAFYLKRGAKGKAQSLLEGISLAQGDTICMIDADLQYPPEHIPEMLARIAEGSDVVVANRIHRETTRLRNTASSVYRLAFSKLLHGFDVDVQSGLKVFRKAIFQRITIEPSAWSFDLEFLTQARDAGYIIDSINVPFHERVHGQTKVRLLGVSAELTKAAIKNKLHGAQTIPFQPDSSEREG